LLENTNIKRIGDPKIKILSSFTHPQVVLNLYEFLSSAEQKKQTLMLKNMGNQAVNTGPIDFQ